MFFVLSKTVGVLADPATLGSLLLVAWGLLFALGRRRRLRRVLGIVGASIIVVFSIGVVSDRLLAPLENRHQRPEVLSRAPAAIVMLTGMLERDCTAPASYEFGGAADRFIETMRLAAQYPQALVVLSGGVGTLSGGERAEAEILADIARDMGLQRNRLRIDATSRNTHENAVNTVELLKDVAGEVLLVTSASHMPRAMACFKKAGRQVTAWPTDFHRRWFHLRHLRPELAALQHSQTAIREYLGLLAYWIAGYI